LVGLPSTTTAQRLPDGSLDSEIAAPRPSKAARLERTVIATRIGFVAALMMVALLRPLSAQQTPVSLGQWVRVVSLTDSAIHQGRLILVVADTVVLEHGQRQEYFAVGSRNRLEVARRVHPYTLKGALLGVGIGMAAGELAWAWRNMFSCPYLSCNSVSPGQTGRVVIGGLVGLGIGVLIGAHTYRTFWDSVPPEQLDRLRIGIVPQPGGGLGLGASLAF